MAFLSVQYIPTYTKARMRLFVKAVKDKKTSTKHASDMESIYQNRVVIHNRSK